MHDLQALYRDCAARLAWSADTRAWNDADDPTPYRTILRHGDLPAPPAELATDGISIRTGEHIYPSLRVDWLQFCARPEGYRALGLWMVACLLEPGPGEFWLRIMHGASDVRHLCVDTGYRADTEAPGLHLRPHAVVYHPSTLAVFPLADAPVPRPHLQLTDRADRMAGIGDAEPRDAVTGLGSDAGAWAFAELLLNLGQAANARVEVSLEGEFGFGGVAPGSAEVRLWLPGSVGWDPREWSDAGPG